MRTVSQILSGVHQERQNRARLIVKGFEIAEQLKVAEILAKSDQVGKFEVAVEALEPFGIGRAMFTTLAFNQIRCQLDIQPS